MLILAIRRAEIALKDGRLDEAFELTRSDEMRAHRRGQRLVSRLGRAFVERGRENLTAGRLQQARVDCEKAADLAGNLTDVTELKTQVGEALQAQQRKDRRQADVVAAARQHIENGRLSLAQQLLEEVPEAQRAQPLYDQADARRRAGESALARARNAIGRQDWQVAILAIWEAQHAHSSSPLLSELSAEVTQHVVQQVREAIDQGRLDQAKSVLECIQPLSGQTVDVKELSGIMDQCQQAFASIQRGQPRPAIQILRRLTSILPRATWLAQALDSVQQAAEGLERVHGGPLALLNQGAPPEANKEPRASARADLRPQEPHFPARHQTTQPLPPRGESPEPAPEVTAGQPPLPPRFMLHVDGVGSFLVLRDHRVTVGPGGSSCGVDVPLLADSGLPTTTIERTDEDYFLSSAKPVRVNGSPVTRTLLADGDRITLSSRRRLKFMLPHAASTTARLQLAGTRLQQGDARSVILLDKTIIVGPGPSAHIRVDAMPDQAILHLRDGRLFCRSDTEITVNGRRLDRMMGIPINAHVTLGPVSMTLAPMTTG